jgi:O-antigen/teichoic acid export membrane protein
VTSSISLRRTGLVVFGARIASIFTGLIFLVMMTRYLSAQAFGLYEVIVDLVTFAAFPAGLVAFWALRDIARGKMFGKTAIVLNIALSSVGIALYFAFSYFSAYRIASSSLDTLLFASVLVPAAYLNQASNSVVAGHKPVVMGYAVIFSEAAKLAVAYPLLIVFKVGIDGVILAILAANLAQGISSVLLAGDALYNPVDFGQGKKWLSNSWLPVMSTLPYILSVADTYAASIAAHDTVLVAHYQAAFSVATLAGYSLYLASATYALMLKGGKDDVMATTLDLTLAFGIPMATGAAVLAVPILHLLNSQYSDASAALQILAVSAVCFTVSSVFDQVLLGKDRVDVDESAKFHDYLKSSILFVAEANIAVSVIYLVAVYVAVAGGLAAGLSRATVIDVWSVAQLVSFSLAIVIKATRVRKVAKLVLPPSIGYYLLGAILMGVVIYLLEPFIVYGKGTFFLAVELVIVGGVGLAGYASLVLALDKNLRDFARRALNEKLP